MMSGGLVKGVQVTTDVSVGSNTYPRIFNVGFNNEIWTDQGTNSNASLVINYRGYNAGFTRDRSTYIYDGKAGILASFDAGTTFMGVGTISASAKLEVTDNQTANPVAIFRNLNNSNNADGIRIVSGATTSTVNNLFVEFQAANGSQTGRIAGNGAGTVQYLTSSDRRLKTNIRPTHFTIQDLLRVKVRDYNYRANMSVQKTGFIAQELDEVYPDAVARPTNEEEMNWAVDYGQMTPLLVKGVQDLHGMCKRTDDKVAGIERKLASVESKNSKLKEELEKQKLENQRIKDRLDRIEKLLLSK